MPSWTHFVFGRRSSLASAESGAARVASCGAGADWPRQASLASRMSSFGESMVSPRRGPRRCGPPAAQSCLPGRPRLRRAGRSFRRCLGYHPLPRAASAAPRAPAYASRRAGTKNASSAGHARPPGRRRRTAPHVEHAGQRSRREHRDARRPPCVSMKREPQTRPRTLLRHDLLHVGVDRDDARGVGDADDGEDDGGDPHLVDRRDRRHARRPSGRSRRSMMRPTRRRFASPATASEPVR